MKKLGIQEVQSISTKILVYIDNICRENELKYSIFYGSLIGVERHKGFIPWDDDIDLVMVRKDYDKLLDILAKKNDYILLSSKTRENYRYTFAKLVDSSTVAKSKQHFGYEDKDLGVFVDIFPIDNVPYTEEERKVFQNNSEELRKKMMDTLNLAYARSYSLWKSLIKLVIKFPYHLKLKNIGDTNYWHKEYEENAQKYNKLKSKYCGYLEFINIYWGVFPAEWFSEYEDVEFENHKVMAIKAREEFLTLRYNDYMKLPPSNERVTHHPYEFYKK